MATRNDYDAWIAAHATEPYGRCKELSDRMLLAFPELRQVRGHYFDAAWGEREHWWLVAPDGAVVDPTAAQFPTKGHGEYVPWQEGDPEPVGKCMNCGNYCYEHANWCSDDCAAALNAAYCR